MSAVLSLAPVSVSVALTVALAGKGSVVKLSGSTHCWNILLRNEIKRLARSNAGQTTHDDILLSSEQPRHIDLARDLLEAIRSGQYAVGALLPTESDLCEQTGLSRYAVRQAVQKLTKLGVVERRAGIGTRVIGSDPSARYIQTMDNLSDLSRYAQNTVFCPVRHEHVRNTDGPSELRLLDQPKEWLHIHGLRFSDEGLKTPIALVDIYVDIAFTGMPEIAKRYDRPVHQMIEHHHNIRFTRVDQLIQSVLITREQAVALGADPNTAGLRIVRHYYVKEKLIELTIGLHPSSHFTYSTSFQLDR